MLLISCSNRERNCYKVLNDIKKDTDILISLSNKDMKFCLGCERCSDNLPKYCVLDDYITNIVYDEIIKNDKIIIASPMYMSNINGIMKNLLDRFNPFYNHDLLKGKKIYLVLTGGASKEDNEEEINSIIKYFEGISTWLHIEFEFLDYFEGYDEIKPDFYEEKINMIKNKI